MSKKKQQASVEAVVEAVVEEVVVEEAVVEEVEAEKEIVATVNVLLNLRSAPSLTSKVLAVLSPKTLLTVHVVEGDWSKVSTSTGEAGYVRSEFITAV